MQCYTVLWIRNKLIGKRNISLSRKWPSPVIHLPEPRSAVARGGSGSCISRMGFHLSYLMGSYLRHQSYHDCPPRLCLSQQAQPPNPSNILEVSPSRLWRGKKTTTNPHRMRDPSESTRQCQRQTTFCVRAAAALWFSGWFRETHGCPSPAAPSCSHRVLPHFVRCNFQKLFSFVPLRLCWSFVGWISFAPRGLMTCVPLKPTPLVLKCIRVVLQLSVCQLRKVCWKESSVFFTLMHWFDTTVAENVFCGSERNFVD